MVEGAEGFGEAVTGGLAARAAEPAAGEGGAHDEDRCRNCGTELVGEFCHGCGQPGHVHRTVAAWWHDVAHSVLHFEGKIWRTLPMLAWRPGELTRRYIEGERARFVSPMALFLFTVFLMFAMFSALGADLFGTGGGNPAAQEAAELRQADAAIARLQARRAELARRGVDTEAVERALREAQTERRVLGVAAGSERVVDGEPKTGWARLDKGLKKANENPALLSYKVQTNAYKFSWALIPISLPFLWLLFLHRRRYREQYKAYDHLVFITYSISFMSMVLIAFVVLRSLTNDSGWLTVLALLIPPVHMFRQLKGAYRLSTISALWRTVALVFMALTAVTLFMLLLLGLGLLA